MQLNTDFKFLVSEWHSKPSNINFKEIESEEVKKVFIRYKHLLLNKLFLNSSDNLNKDKAQETWKVNWKKDFLKNCNTDNLSKEIISYPLEEIFSYIKENIKNYKLNNKKQIELANHFNISNLWTLYRIIKALWMLKDLEWKLVNLPVKKFIILDEKLEEHISENNWLLWKDLIEIWKEIGISNPEFLYSWISALWLAEKYNINKMKITKIENAEKILKYIQNNFKNIEQFERNNVLELVENFSDILWNKEKDNITKITSLLRFYWYKVADIREYKNWFTK